MRILAVGGPKGGVGKSTTAVTVAHVAALDGAKVLVVDGDPNRTAADWIEQADEAVPVDVAEGSDARSLARIRHVRGYDLAVIDLPGAREAGGLDALLRGPDGPVVDLLVAPCGPELAELRPTVRVLRSEVIPLGVAHLLVFTRVLTASMPRAIERQGQMRAAGLTVARTIVRRYAIFDEALEAGQTVLGLPGAHSYARQAESDYRALAQEIMARLGMAMEVVVG
jgi:chromosome partitioning protein